MKLGAPILIFILSAACSTAPIPTTRIWMVDGKAGKAVGFTHEQDIDLSTCALPTSPEIKIPGHFVCVMTDQDGEVALKHFISHLESEINQCEH